MKGEIKYWVFIILLVGVLGLGTHLFSTFGFTILSLSNADFIDNAVLPNGESLWSGKTWVLNLVQSGMGQNAYASFSPEIIQNKANSEEMPEEDFSIDLNWDTQQCKWEVLEDSNKPPLATYRAEYWDLYWGDCTASEAENHCNTGKIVGFGQIGDGFSYPKACYCVEENDEGYFKKFGKNWVVTSGKIYLSGKETIFCNLDSEGDTGISQGYCGDKVYAIWNGHLLKNSCNPVGDDYVPVYQDGKLKLVGMNSYNNYIASQNSLIDYLDSSLISGNGLNSKVLSVNSKYNDLNYYSSGFFEGSNYVESLDYSAVNSMWTLYIKSDFLGIYQPKPKFIINNLVQDKSKMKIKVNVLNTGETGSGDLSISCQTPFHPDLNSLSISIQKDSSKLYEIGYSVESNSPVERKCTVKISSVSGIVTKNIDLKYKPKQYCVPNHLKCFDNNRIVKKCNMYGTAYEFVETCKTGFVCDYDNQGEAYCKDLEQGDVCGDNACTGFENYNNCPQDCLKPIGFDLDTMVIIAVIIFMIGIMGILILKKPKNNTRR